MPFTFNQVNQIEVTSASRYRIFFPQIPGVDSEQLALCLSNVSPPSKTIGHIQVKLFGDSFGFRGGRETSNQFTATFYETVYGKSIKSINAWMALVRKKDNSGELKSGYAFNCELAVYNTVGDAFHTITLKNVFPLTYEYPTLEDAGSTPFQFQVTFNQDSSDIRYAYV